MGIAELVKSPVAAGAFGLAGAGAVGIAGWQYLTSGTGETDKSLVVADLFAPGGNDCATVLFGLTPGSFDKETDSSTNWNTGIFTQPTSPTSVASTNVFGCVSSFIKNPTDSNGHLEIELAFRDDNIGWFLRTQLSSGNSYALTHNLFLLEKPTDGQTWSVKTGFEWTDSQLKTFNSGDPVSLKIPWKTDSETITLGSAPTAESKFVGVWKSEIDESKKGIFKEISLTKGSESSDVFGKTGEGGEIVTSQTSQIDATKVYDVASNKWKSVATGASNKDIKATLNAWYKPFKDVKGSWVNANGYCSDEGISSESKIQGICVQAASSES